MSLTNLRKLYRARLRARAVLVQEGLAIMGIAIGVALIFASQVASTSLSRSVQQLTREIVGTAGPLQLQARGPQGFDERLLVNVRRLAGVQSALPVLEQRGTVAGRAGQRAVELIGIDPRFAKLGGPLLRRFSAAQLANQRAIALPLPLANAVGVGALQTVTLQTGALSVTTLVGTTLQERDIGGLVGSPVAIAPIAYAQRITGLQGRVTRIFIRPRRGRSREVEAAVKRLASHSNVELRRGDYDATLFSVAVAPQTQSETLFSAISALVAFMFALNAMLITVPLRARLVGELRLAGGTPLMILQVLLFDAAVLGVLACAVGLALGELLSLVAFRATPGYLSFAFPVGEQRIVTWQSVVLALMAGLVAAVVGVLWPLRNALARERAQQDAEPSSRARRAIPRLGLSVMSLLGTGVILLARPSAAIVGNVLLLIALICLVPFVLDGLLMLFERVRARFIRSASPRLAVVALRAPQTRVRSLAIATTAAVAVFAIVQFQGVQANLARGLDASARGIDSMAAVWVAPGGDANAFATTSFGEPHARALAALSAVKRLQIYRGSFLDWGKRRLWILAPPAGVPQPVRADQLVRGMSTQTAAELRRGGWAVLSAALAAEHGLRIGHSFTMPSPYPVTLRVAALSSNLGWPPGSVIMSSKDYARAWGNGAPSAYLLEPRRGVEPSQLRQAVRQVLGTETALAVETTSQREQRHFRLAAEGLSRLTQIRLLALFAAVLALSSAIGAMLWQRRDLIAFRKVDGFRRGTLLGWLAWESGLLLVTGCLIGAALGLLGQLVGSHFLASVTGFPIVFDVEVVAALMSFGLVSIVAFGIVLLPGYHVVRVQPRMVAPAY